MLKQTCSNCQILTEKPLITLLHTTMFFILFIYYDCTRNLWFALKTWDNVKVLFSVFRQLTSNDYCFSISSVAERTFHTSLYARDPRHVLCSGFHAVDSEFQVLSTGFRITIFSGIPDSKAKDFRFHKHKFPWFRNPQEKNLPNSRTWGDLMFMEILKCLRAEQGPR